MDSDRKAVTLSTSKDWDTWFELLKTKAIQKGVWDLIDPDQTTSTTLDGQDSTTPFAETSPSFDVEPQLPLPLDVNPEKTRFSQLTADEKEELTVLREHYKRRLKIYDRKQQGLVDLRLHIQESVALGAPFNTTVGQATAKDMLLALRKRFSPTDETREREAQDRYLQMRESRIHKANTKIDTYLDEWREAWDKAQRQNLPDVGGNRAQKDFLRAVKTLYDSWVAIQRDKLNMGSEIEFLDLVEQFRRYYHDRDNRQQPRGAFTATLQGRPPPPRNDCLCGEAHRFVACPYLAKEARTTTWSPDKDVIQNILHKLNLHESLRGIITRKTELKELQPLDIIEKGLGIQTDTSITTDRPRFTGSG